ncbi:S24 family peptidase [Pseudomonas hefeiensis]|uniref:S24 family peptidase n=1 Tax=Pseudomonas hefeiensis TaxID=2738125 RepID=A0ABY9GIR5_9PSED|nr:MULTISPECIES: S24 family peptidase [unclassified Pseudomonas]WLH15494.1 S24 family peptidase [Pseudomonas sp. FP205]WLH98542.1 S24 family peptidase [Pseudomonas sp. FP53]WLI42802.1 S24 family peptidase [Pseudomonas sp. FP821]
MDIYAIRKQQLISLIGSQRKGACAERWGMAPAHLSQILSDKTAKNLGDDVARRIEAIEGLPRGWFDSISPGESMNPGDELASGEHLGEASVQTAADQIKQMLSKVKGLTSTARDRIIAAADETSNVITVDFSRPGQVGDEVWIAHYDVRAAMGGGQIPHEYPEMLQDIRVSPKHLREMGVTFKEHFHLKMITGWGQSMAPTIKDRDPLLVDITIREFTGDGIYLFSHDDMLYVKRLQKKGKERFKMISDNKHHDPEDIRVDDTHILARVLYVWNGQPV